MRIGILPAVGSGLGSMVRTGQLERLFVHLSHYADRGQVRYFSYLDPPEEHEHWRAFREQCGGELTCVPVPKHPVAALLSPLRASRAWGECTVFRAMNLLAAIPAVTMRLTKGTAFVVSHGADYETIAILHGRSRRHLQKWALLRRIVFSLASAVLVPRADVAARFRARYPSAKIHWQPNWIDPHRFRPVDRSGRPESVPKRIYYVGRLVEEKNLIRAARVLRGLGLRFICIGEGPLAAVLHREQAEVLGPQPWESLPTRLADADAFILPSLTEGHPKALLEAMACGVPVAVSDRVGEIAHEQTGVVFGAEDEASMGRQIRRLVEDLPLAARLGAAARAWVVPRYDIGRVMPQELDILQRVAR